MDMFVKGNNILIEFKANEDIVPITLPVGYSYNRIHITEVTNYFTFNNIGAYTDSVYCFPPINSKSPGTINIARTDSNKVTRMRIAIEKFGQIPDPHYFDNAFKPILVTGDDGNEYKVIPSDQFK